MDCIICLGRTKEKSKSKCECKYNIHKRCYNQFLQKSKFICPICRKLKVKKVVKEDIDFIIKLFFSIYLFFIFIVYFFLIYINFKVFYKIIIYIGNICILG